MAITIDTESKHYQDGTGTSRTLSHTAATGDNAILVATISSNLGTTTDVEWNGTPMTLAKSASTDFFSTTLYYLTSYDTGAHDLTYTCGDKKSFASVFTLQGVDLDNIVDADGSLAKTDSANVRTVEITTTNDKSMLIGSGATNSTSTPYGPTGLTQIFEYENTSWGGFVGYTEKSPAGDVTTGIRSGTTLLKSKVYVVVAFNALIESTYKPRITIY